MPGMQDGHSALQLALQLAAEHNEIVEMLRIAWSRG